MRKLPQMKFYKQIIYLITVTASSLIAQTNEKFSTRNSSYKTDNENKTALDSVVQKTLLRFIETPQNCGISIGISKNGVTHFYNYGETKRNSMTLPNKNTVYEIGSVTKTFCGTLLAYAVLDQKINLEDDIRNYLPGKYVNLSFKNSPILIKHLANHTSGLPRVPENLMFIPNFDSLNPYNNYSKALLFDYLKTLRLSVEPGTVCDYSNLGMALLGNIIENVYNKPFDELIKEKICLPNKLNQTTVNLTEAQLPMFADGHNGEGMVTSHWNLNGFVAAGGMHSTAEDMLNYLNYHMSEQDGATKLAHKITFSDKQKLGLGWFISKTKFGNDLIWHNGGTYGFSSFCGFIKEKNCSIIVLANSAAQIDYIGLGILNYLQQQQ